MNDQPIEPTSIKRTCLSEATIEEVEIKTGIIEQAIKMLPSGTSRFRSARTGTTVVRDTVLSAKSLPIRNHRWLALKGITIAEAVEADVILNAEGVKAISSERVKTIHSQTIRNWIDRFAISFQIMKRTYLQV